MAGWLAASPTRLCSADAPRSAIAARIVTRPVQSAPGAPAHDDAVAVEEPLEIRIAGDPVAITMRTPGDDGELALGFLYAEGIIDGADDVGGVAHCGRPGSEGYGNVIEVTPGAGTALVWDRVEASRRGTLTTAACGVCGRRSIDDLLGLCSPLPPGPPVGRADVVRAVGAMAEAQSLFARTGGTHAAAAHTAGGERLFLREDVGRHNAVDKVVGALLKERLVGRGASGPRQPAMLVVSGRASFEIVQKAVRARIPVVASVSAPTSLAVDLAGKAGLTLVGFVRAERVNVYSSPARLHG
ncbi:MAG: formate dehydrogenase accessory sulfurtransferase FdhD [Deltaproteobacteria bacterium]|nr:formate dehydrogenase accessory sulfurtransferase FdhD [Deltaproteobacteria bacterium]